MPVYESKLSARRRALGRNAMRKFVELATAAAFAVADLQTPASSPTPPTPTPLSSHSNTSLAPPSRAGPRLVIVDILRIIFAHLDRCTLVQCSRVNRLCFEVTGEMLYHSVEYGTEWLQMSRKVRHGRNIFAGLDTPAPPPYPWRDWFDPPETWPGPLPGHKPFQPSQIKLNLLRHVRHLTIFNHPPEECDTLSHFNLFPSLETLTIYDLKLSPNRDYQPEFGRVQGLFGGLEPKHLRLAHIEDVAGIWCFCDPFPPLLCYALEKVIFQFLYTSFRNINPNHNFYNSKILEWIDSVEQIDLVFCPEGLFARNLPPLHGPAGLTERDIGHLFGLVADVLLACTAGWVKKIKVRMVGLDEMMDALGLGGAAADEGMEGRLKEEYKKKLAARGIKGKAARRRYEGLSFITLGEYWREGNLAF